MSTLAELRAVQTATRKDNNKWLQGHTHPTTALDGKEVNPPHKGGTILKDTMIDNKEIPADLRQAISDKRKKTTNQFLSYNKDHNTIGTGVIRR